MPILELLLAFPFGLTSYRWKVQIKSSHAECSSRYGRKSSMWVSGAF